MRWHTEECMQFAIESHTDCIPACANQWRAFVAQLRVRIRSSNDGSTSGARALGAYLAVADALGITEEVNSNN